LSDLLSVLFFVAFSPYLLTSDNIFGFTSIFPLIWNNYEFKTCGRNNGGKGACTKYVRNSLRFFHILAVYIINKAFLVKDLKNVENLSKNLKLNI
jgi:hypothetical protein